MRIKKIIALVFVSLMLLMVIAIPAAAASGINAEEQAICDLIFNGVVVDGKKITLTDQYRATVQNYLNKDGVDITTEEKTKIEALVNEVYAEKTNADVIAWAKDGAAFPKEIKTKIIEKAAEAAKVVDLTLTFNAASNNVTIKDSDGAVLLEAQATVKQTGAVDYSGLIVAGVVLLGVFGSAVALGLKKSAAKV